MNPVTSAIGWTLVDFVWQGAVIGLVLAVALAMAGHASPQRRYAMSCVALLACVLWPVMGLVGRLAADGAPDAVPLTGLGPAALTGAAPAGIDDFIRQNMLAIVGGWAVCAGALAIRMSLGLLWIGRATGSAGRRDAGLEARLARLATHFGIARTVGLRVVDALASPVTVGWLRPVVLVPASLVSGMPPDLLDALLAHELAHVRRMDYLVNLVQNVIEALLFYHPAVWWISKQVRDEREKIADDFAASKLGEPRRLALALSELEKLQFSHHHLAQAANGGNLMVRIKRLIRPETQARSWKAAVPVLGLLLACAVQYPQPALATSPATAKSIQATLDFGSCAKPVYPADALAQKATGTVTMEFDLSTQGKVTDGRVTRSSGHASLDSAALEALKRCSFKFNALDGAKVFTPKASVQYVWALD